MTNKLGYLPKEERKKVLLLCDDIRMHSGIATMAREFVIGSAHHFNWFQIAAAVKHQDTNKILDISEDVKNFKEGAKIFQPGFQHGFDLQFGAAVFQ